MSWISRLFTRGRRRDARRPLSQRAPAQPGAPLILGGRVFRPIGESTVDHDIRFMALLRELGLDDPHRLASETPEQYAVRLLNDLIASGRTLEVLGHLLIPGDLPSEEWTPAVAAETATFIGALSSPADKAQVRALTLSFLCDFFEHGLGSWALSTSSSSAAEEEDDDSGIPGPMEATPAATASGAR